MEGKVCPLTRKASVKRSLRAALILSLGVMMIAAACGSGASTTTPATSSSGAQVTSASSNQQANTGASAATAEPTKKTIPADWPKELNCGLFGGDDAEAALNNNKPIADYLSKKLGIPVKYTTGTSYNAVIEAMRAKHTDCGTVGSFSYILAVQEAGAEALAVTVSTQKEPAKYDPAIRPAYFSVISVKKGNGINSLADLRGKTFSFVDPASTSGYLIPKTELLNNGIDPDKDMKTIFAGSHPTSALALWNGKVDAAATTEATLYNLAKNHQIDFCGFPDGEIGKDRTKEEIQKLFDSCPNGKIAMLAISDPIPNSPFSVRSDLPQSLKDAIHDALVETKDDPAFIAATGRWYIDPTKERGLKSLDNYYDPLRKVAKQLDLDLHGLE